MSDERNITLRDVQVNGDQIVLPSGSNVVASYNWSTTWTKTGNPCIFVPGAPAVYVPPPRSTSQKPRNIPSNRTRRKHNLASGRGFTLAKQYGEASKEAYQPLFRALDICSPGFDMDSVDIVTDRINLRNLLRFCDSPGGRASSYISLRNYRDEPFKFFIHGIGKDREAGPTLVFSDAIGTTYEEEGYATYAHSFAEKLTDKDRGAPAETGGFRIVAKMSLDGMVLLVRTQICARETTPGSLPATPSASEIDDGLSDKLRTVVIMTEEKDEPARDTSASPAQCPSPSESEKVANRFELTCTKSGELLGDEPQLLQLRTKNQRYSHEIYWKDFYWSMALAYTRKLVLGLHVRGTFDRLQQLPIKEVKARAEREGSTSMVYLANTLREVVKAAHCLMAEAASSVGGKGGKARRRAVVVEYAPPSTGVEGTLHVRLAVIGDGAVAP